MGPYKELKHGQLFSGPELNKENIVLVFTAVNKTGYRYRHIDTHTHTHTTTTTTTTTATTTTTTKPLLRHSSSVEANMML